MHDAPHRRAWAHIVQLPVIVEGEHARGDEDQLEAAGRQMEVGRPRILPHGEVGRHFLQQEGVVVGVQAFQRAMVERLGEGRLLHVGQSARHQRALIVQNGLMANNHAQNIPKPFML